jgi:hypothetical protein
MTAVDWLIERFLLNDENIMHVMIKAKLMEKEQIVNAHNHGEYFASEGKDDANGLKYYNETYVRNDEKL